MNIAIPNSDGTNSLLTNEGLKRGDEVFPLLHTYTTKGKVYVTKMAPGCYPSAVTVLACTGWPSEPHVVTEFYNDDGIPHIRTDKGYGVAITYFKLIE